LLYVQADMVAKARVDVVKDDGVVTITVIVSCAYELIALLFLKPYSPFFLLSNSFALLDRCTML